MTTSRSALGFAGLLIAVLGGALGSGALAPAWLVRTLLLAGLALCVAWAVSNRKALSSVILGGGVRAGTSTILYASVVLGVVVLVNYVSDQNHFRRDLTRLQSFSLSEASRKVIDSLEKPVTLYAFLPSGAGETREENILREYGFASRRLTMRLVDPVADPGLAQRFRVEQVPAIVAASAERFAHASETTEEAVTSALITITREMRKRICFLSGHGERSIEGEGEDLSAATDALRSLHYEIVDLPLARVGAVPEDCEVLVIAAPKTPLAPAEIAAVNAYLEGGGRLFAMVEPFSPVRLDEILVPWGLRAPPGILVSEKGAIAGSIYTQVVSRYEAHPITASFRSNQNVLPTAGVIEWFETDDPLVFHSHLIRTDLDAWSEFDLAGVQRGDRPIYEGGNDRMDVQNGLSAAAVAYRRAWQDATRRTRSGEEKEETRVVLFGDVDFATDAYYGVQANGNLFLNALNWLAEEEVFIARREPERRKTFDRPNLRALLVSLALPPFAILVTGLVVWWRRVGL